MWIFCEQGFFSAVQHRERPENVLIRARFAGDLERLVSTSFCTQQMKDELTGKIEFTPYADYAFRLEMPKCVFAEISKQIADNINYDNFKNHVHEGSGSARDQAYMECWSSLWHAQHK